MTDYQFQVVEKTCEEVKRSDMKDTCINVRNLNKSFSGRKVVNDLTFTIKKGEVYGILGHNGAGKSTSIDLILGLKSPDSGSATILGMDASKHRKQVFERVGVQLQHTEYQSMMTVEDACSMYASLYSKPADVDELLEAFDLTGLKKSLINKLSGGERQKLSVVLALVGNPEVVFLDELTTGLDVAARREAWRALKHLKERGLTIFLTTHYMEEAEALCDRVCLIKSGEKVLEGNISDVVKASGKTNLEEAYLYFMGETDLLEERKL